MSDIQTLKAPQTTTRFDGAPKGGKHMASNAKPPQTKPGPRDTAKGPTNKGAIRSNKTDTARAIKSTGQTPGVIRHSGDEPGKHKMVNC